MDAIPVWLQAGFWGGIACASGVAASMAAAGFLAAFAPSGSGA